jgi:hypothetical protein
MSDEQDRAESLDDDKGAFAPEEPPGVDVIDQTADADPGRADIGAAMIDDGESGSDLDGVEPEQDGSRDPFHNEEPAPEVSAVHITEEPG